VAWTVEPDPLHPEEALAWFRRRLPLPDPEFRALREEARRRAFWVAGLAALDLVQEVMDALEEALAQGEPFPKFQARLPEKVREAWGEGSRHRLQTIFRTNLQLAYGAGRWKAAQEVRDLRPYWGLQVVLDGRTSRICAPLAGVVLPADHPFWRNHIPPLHFGCRTALVTYSREEGERLVREPPPHEPQPGFGKPPTQDEWSPNPTDYHPELWRAYVQALGAYMGAIDRLRALAEGRLKPEKPEDGPGPMDALFAAGVMSRAPFSRRPIRPKSKERETFGHEKRPSLELHLLRRTVKDKQLSPETSEEDYERICQEAALNREAALLAYSRAQGPVLAALVRSEWVVPERLRGPMLPSHPYFLVVYSFHSGTLATGYAASDLSELDVPWEEVVWLRKPSWVSSPI